MSKRNRKYVRHDRLASLNGLYNPQCEYGCGNLATVQFSNGIWCCEKDFEKCPSVRKSRGEHLSKFTKNVEKCRERIKKIKGTRDKKRAEDKEFIGRNNSTCWNYVRHDIVIKFDEMYVPQCEYGCGNLAHYQLYNGRWCCCKKAMDCIGFKEEYTKITTGKKRPKELGEKLSKMFKGRKLTKEQCEKISLSKRGKKLKQESIAKREKTKKERYNIDDLMQKTLKTKIEKGQVIPIELQSKFNQYKSKVMYFTRRSIKEKFTKEDLQKLGINKFHIDHVHSIYNGFLENASPEIIGSKENLSIVDAGYNSKKRCNSDITLLELICLIEENKSD